jgi:histidinol phosphatase-like PHP family hydrolase
MIDSMIDLHAHTLNSDGVLVPSELTSRAREAGYHVIAITDHVDISNIEDVIERTRVFADSMAADESNTIRVIPGVELTHIPPAQIASLTEKARALGASIVLCHGETIVEPVTPGTNRAAIEAGVDILAHPGLVSLEDAKLATSNNVLFEITTRAGHSLTNGHVARISLEAGTGLVLNTDTHAPGDLIDLKRAEETAIGAGLNIDDFERMRENAKKLVEKICA